MRLILFIVWAFVLLTSTILKGDLYRVFFTDKGPEEFSLGSNLYEATLKSISTRSLERRMRFVRSDSIITYQDAPIYPEYIRAIENIGGRIRLKLKWLNYVVVELTQSQINDISNFSFIRAVQPVGEIIQDSLKILWNNGHHSKSIGFFCQNDATTDPYFGQSTIQLKMLGIDSLLRFGVSADSIIIGVIDTGFRWKQHKSTQNTKVLAEWDFIYSDSITSNEEQDTIVQDGHGSMVMSILSANLPGILIGSSPFSCYLLAKTEDIRTETHFEEDCFAAALEWMDSIGVDVITSSLGYRVFDTLNSNYEFQHLDGKTPITSYFANQAALRGISMITSAGNKGPRDSTIQAPGDAFFEITVGAVNLNGDSVLNFSSRGPTSDGRIKPDVCAMGIGVAAGNFNHPDSVMYGSGTSVASPLIAGGVALLHSAFEELHPFGIIELLRQASSYANNPRNDFGWGVPNLFLAANNYDILISDPITFSLPDRQRIMFNIHYKYPIEKVDLFIRTESDSIFLQYGMRTLGQSMQYFYDIMKENQKDSTFYYYIVAKANDGKERRKPFYSNKFYRVKFGDKSKNLELIPDLNFSSVIETDFFQSFNFVITNEICNKESTLRFQILSFDDQSFKISIFDLLGKEMMSMHKSVLLNQTLPIDLNISTLSSGIYFLKVTSNSGESKIGKFILVD